MCTHVTAIWSRHRTSLAPCRLPPARCMLLPPLINLLLNGIHIELYDVYSSASDFAQWCVCKTLPHCWLWLWSVHFHCCVVFHGTSSTSCCCQWTFGFFPAFGSYESDFCVFVDTGTSFCHHIPKLGWVTVEMSSSCSSLNTFKTKLWSGFRFTIKWRGKCRAFPYTSTCTHA